MNWLLMSRAFVLFDKFKSTNPAPVLDAAQVNLQDMLARSINNMLHKFPAIDNIVMIADGGSWRKSLTPPAVIEGTTYKGNRELNEQYDWHRIFEVLRRLTGQAGHLGITISQGKGVEGDDWAWYWSRYLNERGKSCIIWTSDQDLKQLVQSSTESNTFTAWYNDQAGLWLDKALDSPEYEDSLDFFMAPINPPIPIVEDLKKSAGATEHYLNPFDIVLEKVLCGDSGDNIKPVAQYKKNGRIFKFSRTDFDWIQEKYHIKDIDELLQKRTKIAEEIAGKKKFKPYKLNPKDIAEMIVFNIRLVWLNPRVIPAEIVETMTTSTYSECDMDYIKNNYKMLAQNNDQDIQDIFDSIVPDAGVFEDLPE